MITFSTGYYPMWQRGGLCFHENGGRKEHECLDATLVVWKFTFGFTVWHLGRHWIGKVTRFIPVARNRRGFCVGLLPLGAKE